MLTSTITIAITDLIELNLTQKQKSHKKTTVNRDDRQKYKDLCNIVHSFSNAITNPPVTRSQCSTQVGRPGCGRAGPGLEKWQGRGSVPPLLLSDMSPSSGSAVILSAGLLHMSDYRHPSLQSPSCGGKSKGKQWGRGTEWKCSIDEKCPCIRGI